MIKFDNHQLIEFYDDSIFVRFLGYQKIVFCSEKYQNGDNEV